MASYPQLHTSAKQLRLATCFLRFRDYTNCRRQALLAQRSDQTNPTIPQILAVADVLSAAKNNNQNWSSILLIAQNNIDPKNLDLVHEQFRKLVTLVNPSLNKFPFANDAFGFICNAWNEFMESRNDEQETFWTLCPYCYHAYEYEKKFEGYTFRCQKCMFCFHGLRVDISQIVKQNDEHCCCFGMFPIRCGWGVVKNCEMSDQNKGFKSCLRDGGVVQNVVSEKSVVNDGGELGNVESEREIVKDGRNVDSNKSVVNDVGDLGNVESEREIVKDGGNVVNVKSKKSVVNDGGDLGNIESKREIVKDGWNVESMKIVVNDSGDLAKGVIVRDGGNMGNVEFVRQIVKDRGNIGNVESGRKVVKDGGDVGNVEPESVVVKDGKEGRNAQPEVEIGGDGKVCDMMSRNRDISGRKIFPRPMKAKAVLRNSKKKFGTGVKIPMSELKQFSRK